MIYFSLDIETTGLDPDACQILELAVVAEDTEARPLPSTAELPTFRHVVGRKRFFGLEFAALRMHEANGLLKEVEASDYAEEHLWDDALAFMREIQPDGRLVLAGKNVAGFDLRFAPSSFRKACHHRVIDVGSVAMGVDRSWWKSGVPSMLDLAGEVRDRHRALDDARATIEVLRRLTSYYGPGPMFAGR